MFQKDTDIKFINIIVKNKNYYKNELKTKMKANLKDGRRSAKQYK